MTYEYVNAKIYCMKAKNILLSAIFIVVTLGFATEVILYQLDILNSLVYYILSIITFLAWLAFPIIFYIEYTRLKDKVKATQDKYIDNMTPKKPLRFCPTDDQLIEMFKETTAQKQIEQEAETSSEMGDDERVIGKINSLDEEEMTM